MARTADRPMRRAEDGAPLAARTVAGLTVVLLALVGIVVSIRLAELVLRAARQPDVHGPAGLLFILA